MEWSSCNNLPQNNCDIAKFLFQRVWTRKVWYFVTGQYKQGLIKSFEHKIRKASDVTMRVRIRKREQKRQKQWKIYLRNDQSKSELVKFLTEDWSHSTPYAHLFVHPYLVFQLQLIIFSIESKNSLIEFYLNWFMIKRKLIRKRSCVPSSEKYLESQLLVFQQWIPAFQYTRCIFLYKYRFLCISRLV